MTKTIILKCECEDNSIYFDDLFEMGFSPFLLCGNKDYKTVSNNRELENIYDRFQQYLTWGYGVEDFMHDTGVKINANRTKFYKALNIEDESSALLSVLYLVTGKRWAFTTLRGCCQGDWIECLHCIDEMSRNDLDYIEAVFFNTGCELGVIENADDFLYSVLADLGTVDTSNVDYWDYTDKFRNEDIAKHLGFDPAECVFMEEHSSMVRVSSFSVC